MAREQYPDAPREELRPASRRQRLARHALAVGPEVDVEEIECLALSRFPGARWLVTADDVGAGVLRLNRQTHLAGPYAPGGPLRGEDRAGVYDVACPRERGDAPHPEQSDRDGLARTFPDGLPVREEERVVQWLVAAARRLHGSVVVDVDGTQRVLTPDPGARIDLTVYSDVWLAPEAALAVVRDVDRRATWAPGGVPWAGPPAKSIVATLPHVPQLEDDVREFVHQRAEDADIEALTSDEAPTGYAIHLDLHDDGLVAIEIGGEESLPTSLRGLPWADGGAVAYRVRWYPVDDDLEEERPPLAHRVARGRATPRLGAVTAALHRAVGGEIVDEAEFLVAPEDL